MSDENISRPKAQCLADVQTFRASHAAFTNDNIVSVCIADAWLDRICEVTLSVGELQHRWAPPKADEALRMWMPRNAAKVPARARRL